MAADITLALRDLTILVIEDDLDVRELIVALVRQDGANAVGARNGSEALALASGHDFDVILSDLGLPDIPGAVVIRTILAAAKPSTRIAVLSGAEPLELREAREAGADRIFEKPVDWTHVKSYLEDAARRSQHRPLSDAA